MTVTGSEQGQGRGHRASALAAGSSLAARARGWRRGSVREETYQVAEIDIHCPTPCLRTREPRSERASMVRSIERGSGDLRPSVKSGQDIMSYVCRRRATATSGDVRRPASRHPPRSLCCKYLVSLRRRSPVNERVRPRPPLRNWAATLSSPRALCVCLCVRCVGRARARDGGTGMGGIAVYACVLEASSCC